MSRYTPIEKLSDNAGKRRKVGGIVGEFRAFKKQVEEYGEENNKRWDEQYTYNSGVTTIMKGLQGFFGTLQKQSNPPPPRAAQRLPSQRAS